MCIRDRYAPDQTQAPVPVAAAPAASPVDMVAQLQGLADLKDKGILTEAEFETQKAKLLAM